MPRDSCEGVAARAHVHEVERDLLVDWRRDRILESGTKGNARQGPVPLRSYAQDGENMATLPTNREDLYLHPLREATARVVAIGCVIVLLAAPPAQAHAPTVFTPETQVQGANLVLAFKPRLVIFEFPPLSAFTVKVDGTVVGAIDEYKIGMYDFGGQTFVTYHLASAVTKGARVTASYARPDDDDLALRHAADGTDHFAASFTDMTVRNITGLSFVNKEPYFASGTTAALSVAENSAGGTAVGTVAATDPDGDTLTYALDDTSGAVFGIDGSGNVTVRAGATLDHETTASYSATVSVHDGKATDTSKDDSIDATHAVTISVTNVDDPPGAPTAVTVESATPTALAVSWSPPADVGAGIANHDLRYFAGSSDPGDSEWDVVADVGSGTTAALTGLAAETAYRVQVRAKGEGAGPWSASADGATPAFNTEPSFPSSAPTRLSVAENSAGGTPVGRVAATDPDTGDTLTYALDPRSDAVFDIDGGGNVTVQRNAALDHERTARFPATVSVHDGRAPDGSASSAVDARHAVTIEVTNVEEPPGAPEAPEVSAVADSPTSLSVRWSAPAALGAADSIVDYDLRYFAGSGAPAREADWIEEGEPNGPPDPGASTAATITGLSKSNTYVVQVRAAGDGESPWSASGRGTPEQGSMETDRAALVALYGAAGGPHWTNETNWSSDAPLSAWFGVTTESGRVTAVVLDGNGLAGPLPAEFGQLTRLEWLDLGDNALSGSLPPALGDLASLGGLYLHANPLTGPLPQRLTQLPLRTLWVHFTQTCAPADAAFQTWVDTLDNFRGATCGQARTGSFTDVTLRPGATGVRRIHVVELRQLVDTVRVVCGLPRADWTDPVLTSGQTPIRAVHLTELRKALTDAYEACSLLPPPPYTDPVIMQGVTPVKATHWTELRAAAIGALDAAAP